MIKAMLSDGQAGAIVERILDDKTLGERAGNIIAGFSQTFSLGRSPWNHRLEGDKTLGKWRFKVRGAQPR